MYEESNTLDTYQHEDELECVFPTIEEAIMALTRMEEHYRWLDENWKTRSKIKPSWYKENPAIRNEDIHYFNTIVNGEEKWIPTAQYSSYMSNLLSAEVVEIKPTYSFEI
jgi:DUF1680 family protein